MRVVIAEDQILFELLPAMLERYGYTVQYAARSGDELLAYLGQSDPPDVALLDISMPPTYSDEGYETARMIRDRWPGVGILLYSQHLFPDIATKVMSLPGEGGLGYALKDKVSTSVRLRDVLERIGAGQQYVEQELVSKLVGRPRTEPIEARLSKRELESLKLMAEGFTNPAIAKQFSVDVKTVEGFVTNVFTKLDITTGGDFNKRVLAILRWLDRPQ